MSLIVLDERASGGVKFVKYQCPACGFVGTMRKHHFDAGTGCRVCNGKEVLPGYNDVATVRPDLVEFFKNRDEASHITVRSGKKVTTQCPVCGLEKQSRMSDLSQRGYRCPVCYGGYSTPNRFMSAMLLHIGVAFVHEKTFPWSGRYRYDFYIPAIDTIVEMHGNQHYSDRVGWNKLDEVQQIDSRKERLALENGVSNYVVIPSVESNADYLKESALSSGLLELLNVDACNIDWLQVENLAMFGAPKQCLQLWNDGTKDVNEIARLVRISKDSVPVYLKGYARAGLCDYSTKRQKMIGLSVARERHKRSVRCRNTGDEFESIRAASKHYGISEKALQNHLRGKSKSSGQDVNGNKLTWEYIT